MIAVSVFYDDTENYFENSRTCDPCYTRIDKLIAFKNNGLCDNCKARENKK